MVTTIQVGNQTLELLRKAKKERNLDSYDKVIVHLILEKQKQKSFAGYLKKTLGTMTTDEILKDLRDEDE